MLSASTKTRKASVREVAAEFGLYCNLSGLTAEGLMANAEVDPEVPPAGWGTCSGAPFRRCFNLSSACAEPSSRPGEGTQHTRCPDLDL